ncbi:MAG: ferritin-like protein, partial [Parvularculaceae bacterium]|nr:ferritin-like protein [Parvularculaceae bacterium]
MSSPILRAASNREELLSRLAEAAEVEHNLMCVYLYAAFTLKTDEGDGLTAPQLEAVRRWRKEIFAVAHEEMVHLLLVCNLMTAIGGAAHFGRLNFPITPGSLPADMQVRLAPFNRETLQHFVWLERPEDVDEPMGAGFEPLQKYARGVAGGDRLMPHAIDYDTVGRLYAQIEADIDSLVARLGEEALFIGHRDGQIDKRFIGLDGVTKVICAKTAHQAIQGIVAQGESARDPNVKSHYKRFCAVRAEYARLLAEDPGFAPGRPAAHNPVMRRPPTPEGKVFIEAPEAAAAVDLANAVYAQMLRLLIQSFGRVGPEAEKAALIDASVDLMFALTAVAEHATTLPARPGDG